MRTVHIGKGTVIKGKWYNKKFRVVKHLGSGGTASILLVREMPGGMEYAMKISRDMISIDGEYRVLCSLRGMQYLPEAYYRDDCIIGGDIHFFFIMSYLRGRDLGKIYREEGLPMKSAVQAVLILGTICRQLNSLNVYYCDLKPENLVFDQKSCCLYLVDFGGTAGKGESIIHFTPHFDRASWGMGERVADEGYQMFGLSMLLFSLLGGGFKGGGRNFSGLIVRVEDSHLSKNIKKVIIEGLGQKYKNLDCFNNSLRTAIADIGEAEEAGERKVSLAIDLALLISIALLGVVLVIVK